MGDRRMAEIKTERGSLYLYTHWGGHDLPKATKEALKFAGDRLSDEPYAVRIIVDQITSSGRDLLTGFGLMLGPDAEDGYNHDKASVIIDLPEQKLTVVDGDGETTTPFNEL